MLFKTTSFNILHIYSILIAAVTTGVYSLQIFNTARQLSHIEAAPDKSGLVLLDY